MKKKTEAWILIWTTVCTGLTGTENRMTENGKEDFYACVRKAQLCDMASENEGVVRDQ